MNIVLSYRLYIPVKHKTDIRGYWQDTNGKVYRDNIVIKDYMLLNKNVMDNAIQNLFLKGEKAVLYQDTKGKGIIIYSNGDRDILKNYITFTRHNITRSILKGILRLYGGCTIYKVNSHYLIEVYKK